MGQDFQEQHKSLQNQIQGPKSVYALFAVSVSECLLFPNLSPNCKPIATKLWQFGKDDRNLIRNEVVKLLQGIIEPIHLPGWPRWG